MFLKLATCPSSLLKYAKYSSLHRYLFHTSSILSYSMRYKERSQLPLWKVKQLNFQLVDIIRGRDATDNNKVDVNILKSITALSMNKDKTDKQNYHLQLFNFECNLQKQLEKAELNVETAFSVAGKFLQIQYRQGRFLSSFFGMCDDHFSSVITNPILVIKLMFYVYLHGYAPQTLLRKIEEYVEANFEGFNVNDLGFICLGFFRSMTKINSVSLMNSISEKLLRDMSQVSDNHMINILKSLRYSGFLKVSFFEKFSERLMDANRVEAMDNQQTVMHIASFYAGNLISDDRLFELLINRFLHILEMSDQSSHFRSKDISRFLWACGAVQYKPQEERDKYMKLLEYFRRTLNKFHANQPYWLADILMGAVYLDIFPDDFLEKIFNNDVARKLISDKENKEKELQLYLIHYSVAIEYKNYKGTRLDGSILQSLHTSRNCSIDFELQNKTGLDLVYRTLQDMVGEDKVKCYHKLPHFRTTVIELHFDAKNRVLPLISQPYREHSDLQSPFCTTINSDLIAALKSVKQSHGTQADETNENENKTVSKRVLIQILSGKQLLVNSDKFTGHFTTKLRQLHKLGYEVILINPKDAWSLSSMSLQERKDYLSRRLKEDLNINMDNNSITV